MTHEVVDALLVEAIEWKNSRSMLNTKSWRAEDALTLMTGGSGFPANVKPPPQSLADDERSIYKPAWQEAMEIRLDGHERTGKYEAVTPPQGRKPVGVKWVFSYKTKKDGLTLKTKTKLVAKRFSQVHDVDYWQTFTPTTSSASVKIRAAVVN